MHILGLRESRDYKYIAVLKLNSSLFVLKCLWSKDDLYHFSSFTGKKLLLPRHESMASRIRFVYNHPNRKYALSTDELKWPESYLNVLPAYGLGSVSIRESQHIASITKMYIITTTLFPRRPKPDKIAIIHEAFDAIRAAVDEYEVSSGDGLMYIILRRNSIIGISKKIMLRPKGEFKKIWTSDAPIMYRTDIMSISPSTVPHIEELKQLTKKVASDYYLNIRFDFGYVKYSPGYIYYKSISSSTSPAPFYVLHMDFTFEYSDFSFGDYDMESFKLQKLGVMMLALMISEILQKESKHVLRLFNSRNITLTHNVVISSTIKKITPVFTMYDSYSRRYLSFFVVDLLLINVKVDRDMFEEFPLALCFIGEVDAVRPFFKIFNEEILLKLLLYRFGPVELIVPEDNASAYAFFRVENFKATRINI